MILASRDTELVRAHPGERATCPECGVVVIAKCGPIVIWHWAHQVASPGCRYHEETEWHLRWKEWALEHGCRVEVPTRNRRHRADILAPNGTVIELQSKPLSAEDVEAREQAYGARLVWVYRITEEQEQRIHWGKNIAGGRGFWFKRGPKLLTVPTRPAYLDLGDGRLDTILKVRLTLKTRYSDQWGSSYQRMLGIAWEASRTDLITPLVPPDEERPVSANYRALMETLRKARENKEEWYVWVAEGNHKNQPREPVRTGWDRSDK